MDASIYDELYYIHGVTSGKSLYENYRWLPQLSLPMVQRMADYLGIKKDDDILDYGCATGFIVKAFRELGYQASGIDVSEWAIANCDPAVPNFLVCGGLESYPLAVYDWIIAKDVLEHVPECEKAINLLMERAKVGVFAVVPLSVIDGQPYVVSDYEKDVTHIHRLSLATWAKMFTRPGWSVEATYRVSGIKDNYAQFEMGNGFITARRQHG